MLRNLKKTIKNNKQIFNNIVGVLLIKGGAMVLTLFTMPAYMKYFSNQQILGLWFTILSVLSWILTFDLGIGNRIKK